jgi:L-fucose isomerase-like protein
VTFARISTNDLSGKIRAYTGEGMFTDDPLNTFGTKAAVRIPHLQSLMQHICRKGFEHHVAMNSSHCAGSVAEALQCYLGWDVYLHPGT